MLMATKKQRNIVPCLHRDYDRLDVVITAIMPIYRFFSSEKDLEILETKGIQIILH